MYAHDGAARALDGAGPQAWAPVDRAMDVTRSLAAHFAVAASRLAREPGVAPEHSARLRIAEALLRAQAADSGLRARPARPGPFVRLANGEKAPLTVLAAGFREPHRRPDPLRAIDEGLVLLARELLAGLKWYLPGEDPDPAAD